MGKRPKESSSNASDDDMPAWMLNERPEESPTSAKRNKKHKEHKYKDRHREQKKHKHHKHHKHHKQKHKKHKHRHTQGDSDASSKQHSRTSSAAPSALSSVTSTPRLDPRAPPWSSSLPSTPRHVGALKAVCEAKEEVARNLYATNKALITYAPVTPQQTPNPKLFIGPQLSPMTRPARPQWAKEQGRPDSEFFKILSARSAAPAPLSLDASPRPKPADEHECCYNQWGEKVSGLHGPLPSPGSTPILSFSSPKGRERSASALSSKSTPTAKSMQSDAMAAVCQSPRVMTCQPPKDFEFACRGVAVSHSPMCIYSRAPDRSDSLEHPPELAL